MQFLSHCFTSVNFTLPLGIGIYPSLTNSIHPFLGGSRRSLRRRGEGYLARWEYWSVANPLPETSYLGSDPPQGG
ncbi:hypothetical protein Poly59_15240 [Rubripirellula reticaptiva]|uniref:Uncharacterized protein n=1 Tax=Rubripirellula reticaptiva TaxID=2528013 RepID=A0A5C6F452_9BACT|nr:hypothetical protein Poly59_15240 [Rubripirellula reticaptiva]